MIRASLRRSGVVVAGRPGLLGDVVVQVLGDHVTPLVPGRRPVHVLVSPTARDWEAAAEAGARVVVVVEHEAEIGDPLTLVRRGADAVVVASAGADAVVDAVRRVAGGASVLPAEVVAQVVDAYRSTVAVADPLSGRERQILDRIVAGASVKQTAHALGISPKTVENLQTRLFRKLGVRNRAQAVMRASSLGLLDDGPGGAARTGRAGRVGRLDGAGDVAEDVA